ncbi:MAG: hypothetical protein NC093_04390, partial [Alistipes sp.]|nr:hypothetical protein [Alistipes sp.]
EETEPVIEDIVVPEIPEPVQETAPVIEDIVVPEISAPVEEAEPVIEDIVVPEIPEPVQETAPVIEDIVVPEIPEPVQETAPVIEDIVVPEIPEPIEEAKPVVEKAAVPVENDDLILEDIDEDDEDMELIAESLEPKAPVIDDISAALSALSIPAQKPEPVQPRSVQQTAPVLDDISAALNALNTPAQPAVTPVQPVAAPVQPVVTPVQPVIAPVQPVAAPVQPMAAPMQAAGAVGQVISVPQLTGYNDKNQPIYTYVQMQIQGYDASGQPVLVPLPGQTIPAPFMPSSMDKNTRLRDAVAAAKEVPTSTREMTPGQRIAAANAASGAPVTANVSKIATNPHSRSTSQAFISAISESKEYANQSLTETQGLKQRAPVLSSVEDVLSQLGDNSLKEKKAAEARAQSSVPDFQEFRMPGRTATARTASAAPAAKPAAAPKQEERPLTKAELKARKKQEKIDAKFQKEMAKRK